MSNIVTFDDLKQATGYSQPVEVVTWLKQKQIPYFLCKHKRPITTHEALNTALGVNNTTQAKPTIEQY